jgi:hypothetical protein
MAKSNGAYWGFVAAGLMNLVGVLVFSKALTNDYLVELSPIVASRFGLVLIMLWGIAYLVVARNHAAVPALVLVFAVEKAIYVTTWIIWMADYGSDFGAIWARDPLTAIFYAVYGPNDLFFGILFTWVGLREWFHRA